MTLKIYPIYLYILFFDRDNNLLYLHYSGKKTNILYEEILECFNVMDYKLIPKSDIHKSLLGLKDMTFYNIGLQSRAVQSGESYRIISGSAAHNRVTNSTGRMYSNGHIQGSGINSEGISTTIGYSSGSKVWSSQYVNVKDFIKFCKLIGSKINSNIIVKTNTSIDNIPIPTDIDTIPSGERPSFATWHNTTFKENPITLFSIDGQEVYKERLLDLDLIIDYHFHDDTIIQFKLCGKDFEILIQYSLVNGYKYVLDNEFNLLITYGDDNYLDLLKYLTNYPITIQLTDLSTISNGTELLKRSNKAVFDSNRLESIKWEDYNTDISKEFKNPSTGKKHVHQALCEILVESNPTVIIYDHGTHEIADFVVIRETETVNKIEIYHVEAADIEDTGDRVSYLYEVCGQAEKSLIWTKDILTIKKKIKDRLKNKDNDVLLLSTDNKIKHGTQADLTRVFDSGKSFKYEIFVVQPGLSKTDISEKLSHLLASTDDYIRSNANNEFLRVWCSEG